METNNGNSPEYFDEDFYTSITGVKGKHRRDQNCPNYIEYARRMKEAFKDLLSEETKPTLLDIGAGVGIRTKNHIDNGFDAYSCDVSIWAAKHSVIPEKHYCVDIRKIGDYPFIDIVNVERVLGYIPKDDSELAVANAFLIAKKYVVITVICSDHIDQENVVKVAKPGRINIQPKAFWEDIFSRYTTRGWELDKEKTDIMLQNGWDCIWVFKKK